MGDLRNALAEYRGREQEADLLQKPPIDAIDEGSGGTLTFNRLLAMIFTGLLVSESTTEKMVFLIEAIEKQQSMLDKFRTAVAQYPFSTEERLACESNWVAAIAVLRKWAHDLIG
jgi:hypothetical protein